jgi:hypothetical protein
MTSLVCWATYREGEAEIPSSIYMVSDSRITWGAPKRHWDGARKVFGCRIEPHIFGYCGDVVFPSLVISQIVSAIDNGVLFPKGATAEVIHEIVVASLKESFRRRHETPDQDFSILHALRIGRDDTRKFSIWHITYDSKRKEWNSSRSTIPRQTDTIAVLGSGKMSVEKYMRIWRASSAWGRSAAIFSGFCDALFSAEDRYSGGMPQIGALNPGSHAQIIGFVDDDGALYLHGLRVISVETMRRIRWFDRHFEDHDPLTNQLRKDARRYPRPKGL